MKGDRWLRCSLCDKVIDVNLDPDYVTIVDKRHRKTYYHNECVKNNMIKRSNKHD